jgi:hypothetical protein
VLGQEDLGVGTAQMSTHGARTPALVALPLGSTETAPVLGLDTKKLANRERRPIGSRTRDEHRSMELARHLSAGAGNAAVKSPCACAPNQ